MSISFPYLHLFVCHRWLFQFLGFHPSNMTIHLLSVMFCMCSQTTILFFIVIIPLHLSSSLPFASPGFLSALSSTTFRLPPYYLACSPSISFTHDLTCPSTLFVLNRSHNIINLSPLFNAPYQLPASFLLASSLVFNLPLLPLPTSKLSVLLWLC